MKFFLSILLACFLFTSCKDDKDPKDFDLPDDEEEEVEEDITEVAPDYPYGMNHKLPILHTDGRWLCNESGDHINLHGFWQTYTPWFNGGAWGENNWGGKDYQKCVDYNKRIIDGVLASGIKVDFMRMHLDPYWFIENGRGDAPVSEYFSIALMKEYFEKVYLPIIKHCNDNGLYVVLRPYPCGEEKTNDLKYGDGFFKILEYMWKYFTTHKDICNNSDIMFEIANEPVSINASEDGGDRSKAITRYMQHFIDLIRKNCDNIIWVPGLTWQQEYNSFVKYPLKGENLGFAVHCYPGWYGSDAEKSTGENGGNMGEGVGGGYESFQSGWNNSIAAAAELHPIMITEMDWASEKYQKTWGKSFTGLAGGNGFGANFKYIMDKCGNVSYITFTAPNDLALFKTKSKESTVNFWNDPEACPWQIYHWYEEYAQGRVQPLSAESIAIGSKSEKISIVKGASRELIVNAINNGAVFPLQSDFEFESADPTFVRVDGSRIVGVAEGETKITAKALGAETEIAVIVEEFNPFPFEKFNPNVWEKGSFDKTTGTLITGQWGFGGWEYSPGIDIKGYSRIVCELGEESDMSCSPSFRIFDGGGYWADDVEAKFIDKKAVIEISEKMTKTKGDKFDASNVTIIGIWTSGGKEIVIKSIYFE